MNESRPGEERGDVIMRDACGRVIGRAEAVYDSYGNILRVHRTFKHREDVDQEAERLRIMSKDDFVYLTADVLYHCLDTALAVRDFEWARECAVLLRMYEQDTEGRSRSPEVRIV